MKDIRLLKLVSGDDVLCECTNDPQDTGRMILTNPQIIVTMPGQTPGQTVTMMVSFMAMAGVQSDHGYNIETRHIICNVVPIQELANAYIEKFCGISLPKTPELVFPG